MPPGFRPRGHGQAPNARPAIQRPAALLQGPRLGEAGGAKGLQRDLALPLCQPLGHQAAGDRRQQDALAEAAAAGGGVKLPRVVLDNAARREWSDLGQRLAGLKDGVDPRVFEAFQTIREFAASW